jgi:hypothetical protein
MVSDPITVIPLALSSYEVVIHIHPELNSQQSTKYNSRFLYALDLRQNYLFFNPLVSITIY